MPIPPRYQATETHSARMPGIYSTSYGDKTYYQLYGILHFQWMLLGGTGMATFPTANENSGRAAQLQA